MSVTSSQLKLTDSTSFGTFPDCLISFCKQLSWHISWPTLFNVYCKMNGNKNRQMTRDGNVLIKYFRLRQQDRKANDLVLCLKIMIYLYICTFSALKTWNQSHYFETRKVIFIQHIQMPGCHKIILLISNEKSHSLKETGTWSCLVTR